MQRYMLLLLILTAINGATASDAAPAGGDDGEQLFKGHCAVCHKLPNTADLTVEWWHEKMTQMAAFAQLTPEQRQSVEAYVTARAGSLDAILASEKSVFMRLCGSCHDADDPPATDSSLNKLNSFLIDHYIEQTDEEADEKDLHEAAEYMLHRQLAPPQAGAQ